MSTAPTAARTYASKSDHWYSLEGEPRHEIPTVDGKKMKKATLADARRLNLLPSVTTIIDAILRKPALEAWKTEQAVLACLTAPRKEGETDDAFVHRVLQEEEQHMQEARAAADFGKILHDAIDSIFQGKEIDPELRGWVMPAVEAVIQYGTVRGTELVLVGDGYAGRTDLLLDGPGSEWLWDYKTTKKLPDPNKGAWLEHRLQLAAYAAARAREASEASPTTKPIRTGNIYISSVEQGKFVICEHTEEWGETYRGGFLPLLAHWQWTNKYWPGGRIATVESRPFGGVTQQEQSGTKKPDAGSSPAAPASLTEQVEARAKRKLVWTEGVPTPTSPRRAE